MASTNGDDVLDLSLGNADLFSNVSEYGGYVGAQGGSSTDDILDEISAIVGDREIREAPAPGPEDVDDFVPRVLVANHAVGEENWEDDPVPDDVVGNFEPWSVRNHDECTGCVLCHVPDTPAPEPQSVISQAPSGPGPRRRSRRPGLRRRQRKRRQQRRQQRPRTYIHARAAAQAWKWEEGYWWDETAREQPCTWEFLDADDTRDPRDHTVVEAFGHHIIVPRDDRFKYRKWRRYMPIGRVFLKWDPAMRLLPARLRPTGGPY